MNTAKRCARLPMFSAFQQRASHRAFTLVEMLVVVVMVGILATIATIGVRKYIFSAKTSEAVSMIGVIKAAEEAYRDETFTYLDVSESYDKLYPNEEPGQVKRQWGVEDANGTWSRWQALGVQADAPVQYGYAVVAAAAGVQLTAPTLDDTEDTITFPDDNNDPSYCVLAVGDVDGNGTHSYVVGTSFSSELFIANEGE